MIKKPSFLLKIGLKWVFLPFKSKKVINNQCFALNPFIYEGLSVFSSGFPFSLIFCPFRGIL